MKKFSPFSLFFILSSSFITSMSFAQESGVSTYKHSTNKSKCTGRKCPTPEGLRLDFSYDSDLKILTEGTDNVRIKSSGRKSTPNGGITVKLVKQKKLNRSFRLIYGAQAQYAKYNKSYYSEEINELDNFFAGTIFGGGNKESTIFSVSSLENISVGVPLGIEWHFRMLWNSFHVPLYAVPQYNLYSSEKLESCELLSCEANFENEDNDFSYAVNIGLAVRFENISLGVYSSNTRFFGSNDIVFRSTRAQLGYYF